MIAESLFALFELESSTPT